MTENHILVKTTQQQVLENVLCDMANLYADTAYAKGIQLYRKKGQVDSFLVLFTNNPDLHRFSYFTNYLVYPFNYLDFKPTVRGFYKSSDIRDAPQLQSGNWLMIYDNENDEHGDNVYIVNELNQTFIFDFGGRLQPLETTLKDFRLFDVNIKNYHHIMDIHPSPETEMTKVKPWWKFW